MSAVRKILPNLRLDDDLALVYFARKGVKPRIFYSFAQAAKMPDKSLAKLLHLHPRTVQNYSDQQKNLDPVQSEHLLKLISLYTKGEELFGSVDEFNYWLQKPFWDSKELPQDLLNTPGGVDLVADEIQRLAHSYVV
ncbi:MAG: DUF2384 domain-containing protein [Bacteroidota bacterium]|nr:DUF2384 domain-containing protein [Bacteroidota bacterium]